MYTTTIKTTVDNTELMVDLFHWFKATDSTLANVDWNLIEQALNNNNSLQLGIVEIIKKNNLVGPMDSTVTFKDGNLLSITLWDHTLQTVVKGILVNRDDSTYSIKLYFKNSQSTLRNMVTNFLEINFIDYSLEFKDTSKLYLKERNNLFFEL